MPSRRRRTSLRRILRAPAYIFRWKLGWMLGNRSLLLTHIGRRSSRRYHTVLEVIDYRPTGPEFVVMSGFGREADWLRNIEAGPACIAVGTQKFAAAHRLLGENEAVDVVQKYERRNRFLSLIIRIVLSRLLGWNYKSTDSDRHRLVAQLPLIAFRAKSSHADLFGDGNSYSATASFSMTTFKWAVTSLCSFTGTVNSPRVFSGSWSWILRRSMLKPFFTRPSAKSLEVTDPKS